MAATRRAVALWAFPLGAVLLVAAITLDMIGITRGWDRVGFWLGTGLIVPSAVAQLLWATETNGFESGSIERATLRAGIAAVLFLSIAVFASLMAFYGPNAMRVFYYACAAMLALSGTALAIVFATLRSHT